MTFLMVVVLGSIFAGWATTTESAGVGVLGSMLIAWMNGRMTMTMMREAIYDACRANAMVFLLFFGATGFSYVFRALGGDDVMISTLAMLGIETKWEILGFVMVLIFLLGFPLEWIEICLIVLPVFTPILLKLDFSDHLGHAAYFMPWFGALIAVNLQTSFMTPPFGATLVLHERHGAARDQHERRLSRHVSVRGAAGGGACPVHGVSRDRAVAAAGHRPAGMRRRSAEAAGLQIIVGLDDLD